eukprot:Clim_evm57s33 gene=Clim_evmTU57s33
MCLDSTLWSESKSEVEQGDEVPKIMSEERDEDIDAGTEVADRNNMALGMPMIAAISLVELGLTYALMYPSNDPISY